MVFHSVSKAETPPPVSKQSMASTLSPKSQPRHNFPLSNLKWSMNQSNAQRLRRLSGSTDLSPSEHRAIFPLKDDRHRSSRKLGDDSGQSPEHRFSSSSLGKNGHRFMKLSYPTANSCGLGNSTCDDPVATEHLIEKEEKSATMNSIESLEKHLAGTVRVLEIKEDKLMGSEGKSKIFIRIPARSKAAAAVTDAVDETLCAIEDEEPLDKTWNLRPRRTGTKPPNVNGGAPKSRVAPLQESKSQAQIQPELALARAAPEQKAGKKRQKFSVSLLKEEIEEDFLLMTNSRPPRRPKKRARNVQRQLDGLFPGIWLTYVTPDLYRVPNTPHKG